MKRATFKLEFHTDNAAFDGEGLGPEIAWCLRQLADRIPYACEGGAARGPSEGIIRDSNGNTIGAWEYCP